MFLRKGVYPYEYMDDWEKFNETILPEKEKFYSSLSMEDITEANCKYGKRVCKDFEIKALGEYHDLYLRTYVLVLADVFEHFRSMCLKIYKLVLSKISLAPTLAWQAALKKTQVELDLFN